MLVKLIKQLIIQLAIDACWESNGCDWQKSRDTWTERVNVYIIQGICRLNKWIGWYFYKKDIFKFVNLSMLSRSDAGGKTSKYTLF